MDCRNPAMASSMVCQCQASGSRSQVCQQLMGKLGGNNQTLSSLAGNNASLGTPNINPGGMDNMSDAFGEAHDLQNFQQAEGGGKGPNGGGGRAVSASTGGTAAGQKNDGGGAAAASGLNTKIATGFWGGGGGGGSFGGGGGGGSPSYQGQTVAMGNGQPRVDLKQFLPGGAMDPRRRPAGVVGPDGITGPATDLFVKMNMRFMSVGHTLMP